MTKTELREPVNAGRRAFSVASCLSIFGWGPAARIASCLAIAPGLAASAEGGEFPSASRPAQGVPPATDEQRIGDLVTGNHILFDQGVVDGFGHISARCVKNPAHFWLSQSRAPGMVTAEDIIEFNEDSEPVEPHGQRQYVERFIHGEIYRARPDVISVVHSHSPGVIPFGVTGVPLRPVVSTAGFLPAATPVFEIRDVAGEDNGMLITNTKLGAGLAKTLGNSPVVLMRGHGDAVAGPSVKATVYEAIYTQLNAQIQSEAMMLGHDKVVYLNAQEAARVTATTLTGGGLDRVWQIWAARATTNLAALKGS